MLGIPLLYYVGSYPYPHNQTSQFDAYFYIPIYFIFIIICIFITASVELLVFPFLPSQDQQTSNTHPSYYLFSSLFLSKYYMLFPFFGDNFLIYYLFHHLPSVSLASFIFICNDHCLFFCKYQMFFPVLVNSCFYSVSRFLQCLSHFSSNMFYGFNDVSLAQILFLVQFLYLYKGK